MLSTPDNGFTKTSRMASPKLTIEAQHHALSLTAKAEDVVLVKIVLSPVLIGRVVSITVVPQAYCKTKAKKIFHIIWHGTAYFCVLARSGHLTKCRPRRGHDGKFARRILRVENLLSC